jgi:hypothetical protein
MISGCSYWLSETRRNLSTRLLGDACSGTSLSRTPQALGERRISALEIKATDYVVRLIRIIRVFQVLALKVGR